MQQQILNKLKLLAIIVALVLIACDSEEDMLPPLEKDTCRMLKTDQGNGNISELQYNSNGFLVKEKQMYKAVGETHLYEKVYLYSEYNKLTKKEIYKNGDLNEYFTFEYDSTGSVVISINYRDSGKIVDTTTYIYDSYNRIKEVAIKDSKEVYYYDNRGNITSVEVFYGGKLFNRLKYENYDDKPTPQSAVKGKPKLNPEEVSRNNPGEVTVETINGGNITYSDFYHYSYEYNSTGYVTRVILTNESGGKAYDISYIYQCK